MEIDQRTFESLQKYTRALSVTLMHRDSYTRLHADRVVNLSEEIGRCCKLDHNGLNALIIGATFHDVGKIGIPDHILLKPSLLETHEWEVIKRHCAIGEEIMLATELDGADCILPS